MFKISKQKLLNEKPKDWVEIDPNDYKKYGLVTSRDYALLGAFSTLDNKIILFHEYPYENGFIEQYFENVEELKNKDFQLDKIYFKPVYSFIKLINDCKFLFVVNETVGNNNSLQIFIETQENVYSVSTSIDKNIVLDKTTILQSKILTMVLDLIK